MTPPNRLTVPTRTPRARALNQPHANGARHGAPEASRQRFTSALPYSLTHPARVRRGRDLYEQHATGSLPDAPEERRKLFTPALSNYALNDRDVNRQIEWLRLEKLYLATNVHLRHRPNDIRGIDCARVIHSIQWRLTAGFVVHFDTVDDRAYPIDLRDEAVELRTQGRTLGEIAHKLDLCCSDVAHDMVLNNIDTQLHDPIRDLRLALADSLDAAQATYWPAATDLYLDLNAARQVLSIIRRRCALLDLYPQLPRTHQTGLPPCLLAHGFTTTKASRAERNREQRKQSRRYPGAPWRRSPWATGALRRTN